MSYPASDVPEFRLCHWERAEPHSISSRTCSPWTDHQSHAKPNAKGQRREYSPPQEAGKPYGIRRECVPPSRRVKKNWEQRVCPWPFHLLPLVLSAFSRLFFTLYCKGGKAWSAPLWRFLSGLRCFVDFRRWDPQGSISILVTKQTLPLQSQRAQALYYCIKDTHHTDFQDPFFTSCHLRYSQWDHTLNGLVFRLQCATHETVFALLTWSFWLPYFFLVVGEASLMWHISQ